MQMEVDRAMKWMWRIGAGCLVAIFALVIFLAVASQRRSNELADFEPTTTQELRAEVEELRGVVPDALEVDNGTVVEESDESPPERTTTEVSGSVRVRLSRGATEEEIREGVKIGETVSETSTLLHTLSIALDNGLRAVGIAEDMLTNENADNLVARGEYEEARRLYESTLPGLKESDPQTWRLTVSRLAWLEPDPERAYLYLELSTSGEGAENLVFLDNAVRLSEATGSDALAALYRRRLEREKDRLDREAGR